MKKNYIIPSVEIADIQIMNTIAEISILLSTDEGTHIADAKAINFANDFSEDFSDPFSEQK